MGCFRVWTLNDINLPAWYKPIDPTLQEFLNSTTRPRRLRFEEKIKSAKNNITVVYRDV